MRYLISDIKQDLNKENITAMLGISIEYYNIFLYGYAINLILPTFFGRFQNLLITSMFIAFSYFVGTLGALIFGHIGDTHGRKKALVLTLIGVSLPSCVIGILPSYAQIGIYSSILFIIFRVIQTFAFGADFMGLITFILEDVPYQRRGRFGGYMSMAAGLGVFLAVLFLFILDPLNDPLSSWKWKILLFFGASGLIIAYYFYKKFSETETFNYYKKKNYIKEWPISSLLKTHKISFVKVIGITSLAPIITIVVFAFIPFFGINDLHLSIRTSLFFNAIGLAVFSLSAPFFGNLSDKIGRKLVLYCVSVSYLSLSTLFFVFLQNASAIMFCFIQVIFAFIASAYYGVTATASIEHFPTHIRYTGVALGYQITYALFGGINGHEIVTSLAKKSSIYPAYYLIFGALLVLLSASFLKDNKHSKLLNSKLE